MARDDQQITDDFMRRMGLGPAHNDMVRVFGWLSQVKWLSPLLTTAGIDRNYLQGLIRQQQEIVDETIYMFTILASNGWAPSGIMPSSAVRSSLEVYRATADIEAAERAFLEGWDQVVQYQIGLNTVKTLGAGWPPLQDISRARWKLLAAALDFHFNSQYVASVPIVLAQIDGIVQDATENKLNFFSKKTSHSRFTDEATMAGMDEGLASLRRFFVEDAKESGSTGSLSRHGILHGRELEYDTKINSAKVFALLFSVLEWAQHMTKELVERKRREEEDRWKGSSEVDEYGRRRDRRGFAVTRDSLRNLYFQQQMHFKRTGLYQTSKQKLHLGGSVLGTPYINPSTITMVVSQDARSWWAWCSAPTGYCFGIGAGDSLLSEHLYAGTTPPLGGQGEDPRWWSIDSGTERPADWSS
jgi:hypothetical protein